MTSSRLIKTFPAFLVNRNTRREVGDPVACEASLAFRIDEELVATVRLSPADLESFAIGRAVTEGFLPYAEIKEVLTSEEEIVVRSNSGAFAANSPPEIIRPVTSCLRILSEGVLSCARSLSTLGENWQKTGGLHVAVLFDKDLAPVRTAEDIGRHNAVDKVVGYALRKGKNLSECFLVCSGRQPEDMVAKIARAGIPVVVSRAATTDRGIILAEELGVTLIGFAREDRFTVYTHGERVQS